MVISFYVNDAAFTQSTDPTLLLDYLFEMAERDLGCAVSRVFVRRAEPMHANQFVFVGRP